MEEENIIDTDQEDDSLDEDSLDKADEPAPEETIEKVEYSSEHSGHVDTAHVTYTDESGEVHEKVVDVHAADTDADGDYDSIYADLKGEGVEHKVGEDTDHDGVLNVVDTQGEGALTDAAMHPGEDRTVDHDLQEATGQNEYGSLPVDTDIEVDHISASHDAGGEVVDTDSHSADDHSYDSGAHNDELDYDGS